MPGKAVVWGGIVVLLFGILSPSLRGWEDEESPDAKNRTVRFSEWLRLPPVDVPAPAFHDGERGTFGPAELLAFSLLDREDLWPSKGQRVTWPHGEVLSFGRKVVTEDDGLVLASRASSRSSDAEGDKEKAAASFRVAYAAVYLEVDQLTRGTLSLRSGHLFQAWIGREEVAKKKSTDSSKSNDDSAKDDELPGEVTGEVVLRPGKHLLWVKLVFDPSGPEDWSLSGALTLKEDETGVVEISTLASKPLSITDLLDAESVTGVALSSDGELISVAKSEHTLPRSGMERWVEIRRVEDGKLVRSYRGASPRGLSWSPQGRKFSFTTREEKKTVLWVADFDGGTVEPVFRGVERMGGHTWAPDGKSIFYSVRDEPEKIEEGVKRMRDLPDRWAGWRNRSYLYQVSVESGVRRRLTAGDLSTTLHSVHADGKRLLFSRTHYGLKKRPHSETELLELDLESLEVRKIVRASWLGGVQYSPDGTKVLITGGPSTFGYKGQAVPAGTIPNDYDTQAYLVDRNSGEVEAISREFDPSIQSASWSSADGKIYFTAEKGAQVAVFRFDPKAKSFTELSGESEVISGFRLASRKARAVYLGSSSTAPPRVYALDLEGDTSSREILFPGEDTYQSVELGEVRDWSFESREGSTIEGRVYYPPGFDAKRKYPCIVYYYGGTSPSRRSFGGRYPKNLWASHGFVVYVLQPSGSTGFGQEYSARHVNNWGITVADEIIEGTQKFLTAHSFVDPKRVGCIGASYGGFMTMLLVTRTDLFAGAISHAGISSISSYWGEGWWGYAYSAVASAESYPWNRPDVYIGQSPLFAADRVTTPLLLLHGTGDTNVPPGESEQMYTALRLLGREVEYIRFQDEDHWILDHPKRVIWMETILAWFDKTLKKQPEFWEYLYRDDGEKND